MSAGRQIRFAYLLNIAHKILPKTSQNITYKILHQVKKTKAIVIVVASTEETLETIINSKMTSRQHIGNCVFGKHTVRGRNKSKW